MLSICYPVFDDFYGLYASALDIPLSHPEVADDVEIIVVDNNPGSVQGETTKKWVEGYLAGSVRARYVAMPGPSNPALAKQRCVDEASGSHVLVMDSHVRVVAGGLKQLLTFYKAHPIDKDLYSGPMFYDQTAMKAARGEVLTEGYSTHMDEVWRGENLGIWATDQRGGDRTADMFEIPAMGCGLFTSRRDAFVGFNPHFLGFGGEECYLHHKTRQAGNKCFCLPFLRWVHRFARPGGPPYTIPTFLKVRNYVIGHQELGLPVDLIKQHFVYDAKVMAPQDWDWLLEDPIQHTTIKPVAHEHKPGCSSCGKVPEDVTLEDLYDGARDKPSDINQHVPKLRELAAQSEVVVEFGHRRGVSTTALLAAQPKTLVSYDTKEDPYWKQLKARQGKTDFSFIQADVTAVGIPECDLLFEDSRHTADHIYAILTRHAPKVRRWMAFHDTQIFGERGEDGGPGILPALRRFIREHPEWSVVYHTQQNHGFTVISRNPDDKPKLPALTTMAWNYAKALARHTVTGRKLAAEDEIKRRLDICALCPQRNANRCTVCGCYLDEGPKEQDGKAVWAESFCPLGNW